MMYCIQSHFPWNAWIGRNALDMISSHCIAGLTLVSKELQSWTTLLGQMCTCSSLQTRETKSRARFNLHVPNPLTPPTMLNNVYPQFFLTFNVVLGVGGGN